jgi:rhodanese-related sulfurtransferase
MKTFSVSQSFEKRKQNSGIPLIDVRTPAEYGSIHANGAVNHPMESLEIDEIPFAKEQEIHLICQSGGRSMKVSQKLEAAGFTNIVNIEGGTSAWDAAGLPVVEGKKVMSLERQVRIAAGSLVVIGAAVGTVCTSGRVCSIRVYRGGTGLCRGDRYLRDGDDDSEDALEPGLAIQFTRLPPGPWAHQSLFFALPGKRLLLP